MPRSFLLSEGDALEQYRILIEEYSADNTYQDKGNALRTRFDIVLNLALKTVPGDEIMSGGFKTMIDRVLPSDDEYEAELKERLHRIRRIFNEKAQHRFRLEQGKRHSSPSTRFSRKDYENCLRGVIDLIAYLSGVPVPPVLQGATKSLNYLPVRPSARLDVILLMELYSKSTEIEDGLLLFKRYRQMINKSKSLKLHVDYHLLMYAPPLSEEATYFEEKIGPIPVGVSPQAVGNVLEMALDLLDVSFRKQEESGGAKPCFLWLCRGIPEKPDDDLVASLGDLMAEKKFAFYPVALTKSCVNDFTALWPACGPYTLNPRFSENFFISLLFETIYDII